ncbi:CAP domain-containing protein [Selenomonas ruminis]|uniref:CAP domain-containing protein n=2 Tax=Selenomonas ruminis TaxID=2593411 RepID=A0A5D6WA21_9FIRM|nr:CAP domain-containing protein [Selenomonas sp. mPRGC5]
MAEPAREHLNPIQGLGIRWFVVDFESSLPMAGGCEAWKLGTHKRIMKRQTKEARKMKSWRRMVSLLAFALLVFAVSPASAANLDSEILHYVNAVRISAGVAPMTLDNELTAASVVRAEESMVRFAHQRPDGREVKSVLENSASYSWFGENLAVSKSDDAEAIVRAWMNSPTHRANLLNRHYTKMGVSCKKAADGRYYVAQEMACN